MSIGFWLTQGSTALLLLLGGFVALVRPRRSVTMAFGASTAALGVAIFLINLARRDGAQLPGENLGLLVAGFGLSFAVVLAGIAIVVLRFPRRLDPRERSYLWLPASLTAAGALFGVYEATVVVDTWLDGAAAWLQLLVGVAFAVQFAAHGLLVGAAALFALRYAATPHEDADTRRQFVLMAAGLGGWPAAVGGGYFSEALALDRGVGYLDLGLTAVAVAAWLRATRGPASRSARNVALFLCACALSGVVSSVAAGGRPVDDTGFFGVVRLVSFAIFAYAILRHHLLGLDVRVRWTLSRGTMAGVVVALVFIGSQLVQNVTQQEFGVWGGAILAGLALFALAPLQRAADALAQRLVPTTARPGSPGDRESTFRGAYRMALRGGITPTEELTLASLARDLGLDARRAVELRHEEDGGRPAAPRSSSARADRRAMGSRGNR